MRKKGQEKKYIAEAHTRAREEKGIIINYDYFLHREFSWLNAAFSRRHIACSQRVITVQEIRTTLTHRAQLLLFLHQTNKSTCRSRAQPIFESICLSNTTSWSCDCSKDALRYILMIQFFSLSLSFFAPSVIRWIVSRFLVYILLHTFVLYSDYTYFIHINRIVLYFHRMFVRLMVLIFWLFLLLCCVCDFSTARARVKAIFRHLQLGSTFFSSFRP